MLTSNLAGTPARIKAGGVTSILGLALISPETSTDQDFCIQPPLSS